MIDKVSLDHMLKFGVQNGASDIHFEVNSPAYYRVKGHLLPAKMEPLTPDDTLSIAQLILGDNDLDFARLFPERDTSYSVPGVSRFRVSIFRQRGNVGCILRVIPLEIRSFEQLNLPPVLEDISDSPRGLILVTGTTGMGKSTTIATILQRINTTRQAHIITIEDPIEFLFENKRSLVIQREVGSDTHSYSEALVAALRQDPDVIMLGEVRDAATAAICLKAAETGHLVITTLHTPNVVSTIKGFVSFFDAAQVDTQLARFAECLKAVISLRLVMKKDGTDVVPAVEVMRVTHTIQDCICKADAHGQIQDHIEKGRDMYGMQTFDQHLLEQVRNGLVSLEVAKMAASKPAELERAMMLDQ